ncbi:hypothetical protein NL676_037687 [Syzygium grande]|nr:hypothetical protein NL676_037687 [Syzygium grande]
MPCSFCLSKRASGSDWGIPMRENPKTPLALGARGLNPSAPPVSSGGGGGGGCRPFPEPLCGAIDGARAGAIWSRIGIGSSFLIGVYEF